MVTDERIGGLFGHRSSTQELSGPGPDGEVPGRRPARPVRRVQHGQPRPRPGDLRLVGGQCSLFEKRARPGAGHVPQPPGCAPARDFEAEDDKLSLQIKDCRGNQHQDQCPGPGERGADHHPALAARSAGEWNDGGIDLLWPGQPGGTPRASRCTPTGGLRWDAATARWRPPSSQPDGTPRCCWAPALSIDAFVFNPGPADPPGGGRPRPTCASRRRCTNRPAGHLLRPAGCPRPTRTRGRA